MKKYIVSGIILISLFVAGCEEIQSEINSFEECVAAGNPTMESYPRQCRAGDKTFTEEVQAEPELTYGEALAIAQNSECTEKGTLTDTYIYNEVTKTWWINLEMKPEFENKLCSPACVIIEETKTAEINWRCTGLIPP